MRTEPDSDTTRVGTSTAFQPWAQVSTRRPGGGLRAGGHWWHVVLLLGLVVVCSSLACAPQFVGPTTRGYVFALNDPFTGVDYPTMINLLIAAGAKVDVTPNFARGRQ